VTLALHFAGVYTNYRLGRRQEDHAILCTHGSNLKILSVKSSRGTYNPGPFLYTYLILLLVGVILACAAYVGLDGFLSPVTASEKLDLARTALTIVAGSGAIAVLYVGYRKQRTDEANSVREQDRLFTERYTQAVAQLGADRPAVRLGGVYALARISDDSPRDRATCLSLLCAYLRMPNDEKLQMVGQDSENHVRNTILGLVTDRLNPGNPGFWEGAKVDLEGAELDVLSISNSVLDSLSLVGAKLGLVLINDSSIQNRFDASFVEVERGFLCNSTFVEWASFRHAKFSTGGSEYTTDFNDSQFAYAVWFDETEFLGPVEFTKIDFPGAGSFENAIFSFGHKIVDVTISDKSEFVFPEGVAVDTVKVRANNGDVGDAASP
jgi:hypothetical protein